MVFISIAKIVSGWRETYNTSERTDDNSKTTKVAGLESGVLTRRSLTVVPVTDDDPADALGLVITGDGRNGTELTVSEVLDVVGPTVGRVGGADEEIV